MTEAEWLAAKDPWSMLDFVSDRASERKVCLFAVVCARRTTCFNDHVEQVLRFAERDADGVATEAERWEARQVVARLGDALRIGARDSPDIAVFRHVQAITTDWPKVRIHAREVRTWYVEERGWGTRWAARPELLPRFVGDIFGNPFRPVSVDPSWLTSTVVALAEGIYQEKAFDRLPILADSLMDAGCDNADVLTHCRGDGPHVRGCWVVDMLTGRT